MEAYILVLFLVIPTSSPDHPIFKEVHKEVVGGSVSTCMNSGQKKVEDLRRQWETIPGSTLKARCALLPNVPAPVAQN